MSRSKSARRGLSLWLLCGSIAGFSACDDTRNQEPSERSESVLDLSQALQGAVASCAESARMCRAAGDASGPDESCAASFDSCRDAATESAGPSMEAAVKVCAEQAKSCRDAAGDDAAKDACKEQLSACVGEQKPDAGGGSSEAAKPDAGNMPPVATCISTLRSCLEGDEPARTCTSALQDCIAMTVGHNGTPPDHDAGKPDQDASKPERDASKPDERDAGKPDERDAERPTLPDAAMDGNDNTPRDDAGMSGSKPPEDAGTPDSAKECKEAREQCLASGQDSEACARMQRACRDR